MSIHSFDICISSDPIVEQDIYFGGEVHCYDLCASFGHLIERNVTVDSNVALDASFRDTTTNIDLICFVIPYHTTAYVVSYLCQDGIIKSVRVRVCVAAQAALSIGSACSTPHVDLYTDVYAPISVEGDVSSTHVSLTTNASSPIGLSSLVAFTRYIDCIPEDARLYIGAICRNADIKVWSHRIVGPINMSGTINSTYVHFANSVQTMLGTDALMASPHIMTHATVNTGIALSSSVRSTVVRYRILDELDPYALSDIDDDTLGYLDFVVFE